MRKDLLLYLNLFAAFICEGHLCLYHIQDLLCLIDLALASCDGSAGAATDLHPNLAVGN